MIAYQPHLEIVSPNIDKPHRCPLCHVIPAEARKDGKVLLGKTYSCSRCLVQWGIDKEKDPPVKPELNKNPDWSNVIAIFEKAIEKIDTENREPKDFAHYCMENVAEALYGPKLWDWWNSKL